jgi:hypothetical protein
LSPALLRTPGYSPSPRRSTRDNGLPRPDVLVVGTVVVTVLLGAVVVDVGAEVVTVGVVLGTVLAE